MIDRRVAASPRTTGGIGTPARAYSSFIRRDSAQKCGGVQKNTIANRSSASSDRPPVTAAQPTSGGGAPGAPPETIFFGGLPLGPNLWRQTQTRKTGGARSAAPPVKANRGKAEEAA